MWLYKAAVLNLYKHAEPYVVFRALLNPFLPNITESKNCDITTLLVMFQITFVEP